MQRADRPSMRCRTGPASSNRRRSRRRNARRASCTCASTCCTSRVSTCAATRTSTGADTCRSACCLRLTSSSCTSSDDAERLVRGGARERLRRHRQQAQGQHVSAGPSLAGLAQEKSGRKCGVRRRRIHAGQGRTRSARLAAARLLARATSCTTWVTSAQVSTTRACSNLRARLASLAAKQSPFVEKPPLHRPTHWLKPELVAEVNFAGWTPDGYLRAPVFLRLRDDVASHSIVSGPQESARRRQPQRGGPRHDIEEVLAQLEQQGQPHRSARGRCAHPAHEPRPRILARQPSRAATGPHQARPAALPRRACRPTCCRTSRTGRSR